MESVECTLCHRTFGDATLLSLHQQFEPCSSSASAWQTDFQCPLCSQTFDDPQILQIHFHDTHDSPSTNATRSDSLYAQDLERRERMNNDYKRKKKDTESTESYEDVPEDEDAMIARLLQEEENAQSFEEFQNRYGGSSRTSSERAAWNLDKLFNKKQISESKYLEYKRDLDQLIAQPVERAESRTPNLIPLINHLPMGPVIERRLCRPGCDHMRATWLDQGWACGYKNFQMLLSSLRHDPRYSRHLPGLDGLSSDIPSVNHLQRLIENAWAAGFDSEGKEQLNGRLHNSSKWIGPTELMACLGNLNIKTELYEFHQPKSMEKSIAYTYLFEWVRRYFRQNDSNIIHPLYLQHEGHSRTIVGYEQFRDGNIRLLIFDPSASKIALENFLQRPTNDNARTFRRYLNSFQKPVYQILVVQGLLDSNEKETAKRLRSTKVPLPEKNR